MGTLATSSAPPSIAQLRARLQAAGVVSDQDAINALLLRCIQLLVMANDEAGIEQPDELLTLLDGFDPDDDTNETPT